MPPTESTPNKRARTDKDQANGDLVPSSPPLPPLSLSILGTEPLDEFIFDVADFIHHMITSRPNEAGNIEVEAKIGVMKDRISGRRLALPVRVETILSPGDVDVRFESNMSMAQHKHFNNLLNELKTRPNPVTPSPITYSHQFLVDAFYPPPASTSSSGLPADREKIRVTRDEKTGTVIECMRKVRLGDLNVYSPKRTADWRVSVNLEIPVPHPVGSPTHTRRKDRLSYSHEEFNVDLTQVTVSSHPGAPPSAVLHELEIEIARPALLLSLAAKRGDPNVSEHERTAFDELVRAFVNNARILVRNAGGH